MYCWGSTVHGELGLGGLEEEYVWTPTKQIWEQAGHVTVVSTGRAHTLFLTSAGQVYSCGSNDFGQLGHELPRKRPQLVSGLDSYLIIQVACGESHSLALNQWGQVFSWGADVYGQLGHGDDQPKVQPHQRVPKIIKLLAPKHVVQIASGRYHSFALTNDGELYTWGANSHGQLGMGTTTQCERRPMRVLSLLGVPVACIACGADHSVAVSKSGAVYSWGRDTTGQLGLGRPAPRQMYPAQVRSLRSVRVRLACCGDEFSMFLTYDGGVFSCGAATYGQLGHGAAAATAVAAEPVPRKVTELMGSVVTQLACGHRHTIAYTSAGRLYAWGLGASGQLGCGIAHRTSATPLLVQLPLDDGMRVYVRRLFADGDCCFATAGQEVESCAMYDGRQHTVETQLLSLSVDRLQQYEQLPADTHLHDNELWAYLETVCQSLACVNGSFLLPGDQHFGCTARRPGLDLDHADRAFACIARIEHTGLRDLILQCVTDQLLRQLIASPPDAEALRVYLALPLYHEFCNPKHHERLQMPFARAALALAPLPRHIVDTWWTSMNVPSDYFERLVRIYKNVVAFVLEAQHIPADQTARADASLIAALDMLAHLNALNHAVEGLKVPYDTFHLVELNQYVDVRLDYVSWVHDASTEKLYLCNYPFLFDAEAKTLLLQTDQALQMQNAMNEAASRAFFALFAPGATTASVSQYLVLNVARVDLVMDTLRQLTELNTCDLKKPLKVRFLGEEADDAGGVSKEFFLLVVRELFDPKYGMFEAHDPTVHTLWFAEHSFEDELMYLLIGIVCGLAIYNFTIIALPFPLALYKKLLGEPVGLADLRDLSPTVARSLQHVLDYAGANDAAFQDAFALTFEVTRDVFGEMRAVPLKPGGCETPVTLATRHEYVDLYVDYVLNKSVERHYGAFSKGFLKVCGGRVLKLFHSHELRAVIVGTQQYDWLALEAAAEYKGGYSSCDQTIHWFWEVFHELPLDDKKKFLLFLTGSDRIPLTGMKSITITIQPTTDDKYLPVAHTCFNLLDLPRYQTKERLRYKLLQAIQQTEGFSLV